MFKRTLSKYLRPVGVQFGQRLSCMIFNSPRCRKCVQLVNVLFHRAETRAVRRLHHSAETICSELPRQSSHQCDKSSTPSCGDGVFSDVW
ncbi:hypothetical protein RDI58_006253 [Solanum bulbocastanum]|uniref:Uncharacterized protein n=1 Tax=Solanum bulbocastanum TaxID=147425 RepID=A0AAN8YN87_SOLBU